MERPTKGQLITLRFMIFLGMAGMGLFFYGILREEHISNTPLYYILMVSLIFLALKITYEWYHYFSISIPDQPELRQRFSVDVLTTFCPGEPYAMITETLEAIQAISYPHMAYLCDESNDPFLREVCERLGVRHVTRSNRINAKAGNINNALQQATGEICVVLDPDHVPAPDFLDQVLPHFQDPEIGFVQVVQAYKNIHSNTIAKGAAQQTFQFYGPMMMTMNSYGTVQAIGANCTFRRKALDSIGGHAPGLAEDMNTSMKLHAKGWKSVYVPKVLTRGLVPESLSAYYKQQLKWSRGVFELLVTTYVREFWNFTWRQKLHYGLLPWHYFSGAIYLINFLIPIISLFFGIMPMKINLATFLLWGSLFFTSTITIRHYVQRWVMEEDERGFHLVGGLLLIGTWWIHLLGFIFTILRKRVPYDPTPKDGKEENLIGLNVPNISLGLLSVLAITYSLYQDFNPYTLVMAAFAVLNTFFVAFILWASFQNQFRAYEQEHPKMRPITHGIWRVKRLLWLWRHQAYSGLRIAALPVLVVLIGGLSYYAQTKDIAHIEPPQRKTMPITSFTGVFAPADRSGNANLSRTGTLARELGITPGIISTYLAWNSNPDSFPGALIDSIYAMGAYPMITWEPWPTASGQDQAKNHPLKQILNGTYDRYLIQMAQLFKQLNKPLFLRFAHEPDNPAYPWYSDDRDAPYEYQEAWRYVHHLMTSQGASNLIWIFNPWKAPATDPYFPGAPYVDWLGVTVLNYGAVAGEENWNSFEDLYAPFRRTLTFQQNLPVILSEFGTLDGNGIPERWFTHARNSIGNYPEIRAVVLFANPFDQNIPPTSHQQELNWMRASSGFTYFQGFQKNFMEPSESIPVPVTKKTERNSRYFEMYRLFEGVNYMKGQDWTASMHPLFKRTVQADFKKMQQLDLQWIKRFGPGIYDHTILNAAETENLNVLFAFWIDEDLDFLRDQEHLKQLRQTICHAIRNYQSRQAIKAWHLGNPVWHSLKHQFAKPQLQYQRAAYLEWLDLLITEIKAIDPERPVSIELDQDPYLPDLTELLRLKVPQLDGLGINLSFEDTAMISSVRPLFDLSLPVFLNKLPGLSSAEYDSLKTGWLIHSWQDDVFENHVSFAGLLDHHGLKKPAYLNLEKRAGLGDSIYFPDIAILRPAKPAFKGNTLEYHAVLEEENQWRLAAFDPKGYEYTWQLIKTDSYGNPLAMRNEGRGVSLNLNIPQDPHLYRLRLTIARAGYSTSVITPLTTPVYTGSDLRPLSREEIDFRFKQSKN